MYCDMDEMIEHEADRGTALGKKIAPFLNTGKKVSNNFKIELV